MRTRDGLIIFRTGPTVFLKSSALSGWWTLKWRSDSCTIHIIESGPPFTCITLSSNSLGGAEINSSAPPSCSCMEIEVRMVAKRHKNITTTMPIFPNWGNCCLSFLFMNRENLSTLLFAKLKREKGKILCIEAYEGREFSHSTFATSTLLFLTSLFHLFGLLRLNLTQVASSKSGRQLSENLQSSKLSSPNCRSKFMASQVGALVLQSGLSIIVNEGFERSCIALATCAILNWNGEPSFSGQASKMGVKSVPFPKMRFQLRRQGWRMSFALDTGGEPGNEGPESINGDSPPGLGGTRLGRIVSAGGRQLLDKLNSARKNFPMKIFLLLLGFYTANALATILGQTGDWDVLVAGVVVAAIEGIGMLMYRKPPSLSNGRLQSFVVMMNYWKAGVCLGLFVDAFKLGS